MGGGGARESILSQLQIIFELFEGPLSKGQSSQLAIGIDASRFQFWELDIPLINLIYVRQCDTAG